MVVMLTADTFWTTVLVVTALAFSLALALSVTIGRARVRRLDEALDDLAQRHDSLQKEYRAQQAAAEQYGETSASLRHQVEALQEETERLRQHVEGGDKPQPPNLGPGRRMRKLG